MSLRVFSIKPYEVERKPMNPYDKDDNMDLVRILFDLIGDEEVSEIPRINMLFLMMRQDEFTRFISMLHKKEEITIEQQLTQLLVDLTPFENGKYALYTDCPEYMKDGDISKDPDLFGDLLMSREDIIKTLSLPSET